MHHEIGGVVADPLDGQLDDPGGLSVMEQLVGLIVRHQGGIVDEPELALDGERHRREIPGRGAHSDGPNARDLFQRIGRA